MRFELVCSECDVRYTEDPALLVCPACSDRQDPGGTAPVYLYPAAAAAGPRR